MFPLLRQRMLTVRGTRVFRCEEKAVDAVRVIGFDGEGLIAYEYAAVVGKFHCGGNIYTSFQIRMPYAKGLLIWKETIKRKGQK